jgi:hypothetical protein
MNFRQIADMMFARLLNQRLLDIYKMMEATPPRCACACHEKCGHGGDKAPISIGKFCGKQLCLDCAEAEVAVSTGNAVRLDEDAVRNQRAEEN